MRRDPRDRLTVFGSHSRPAGHSLGPRPSFPSQLGVAPARAAVCKEGLARVCCDPYSAPTRKTKHKTGTHLTNYSLSKYDHNFVHTDDPTNGSVGTKRTMSSVLDHLDQTTGHLFLPLHALYCEKHKNIQEESQWKINGKPNGKHSAVHDTVVHAN